VTGLGREQPTVIITNVDQIKTRALVAQCARRRSSRPSAPPPCLPQSTSTSSCASWTRPCSPRSGTGSGPGYAAATLVILQGRFLDTAGTIAIDGDTITGTGAGR